MYILYIFYCVHFQSAPPQAKRQKVEYQGPEIEEEEIQPAYIQRDIAQMGSEEIIFVPAEITEEERKFD